MKASGTYSHLYKKLDKDLNDRERALKEYLDLRYQYGFNPEDAKRDYTKDDEEIADLLNGAESLEELKKRIFQGRKDFARRHALAHHKITLIEGYEEKFHNIEGFRVPTSVYLDQKAEIYNHKKGFEKNGSIYWDTEYTLYEGSIGKGNKPIFIKDKYKLDRGEINLYLEPLSQNEITALFNELQRDAFAYICKRLKISTSTSGKNGQKFPREQEEIINDIFRHKFTFFHPVLPLSKEELKKIDSPLAVALSILKNGMEKEDVIDFVYVCDVPEVNPHLIKPKEYMPFAPHKIIITSQKVGKTSNAINVTGEPPEEKPSEAGLLGYASADSPVYGRLHNRTKQTYMEEVQEEKGEELFGKLHTLMEQGETSVSRGVGIKPLSYSGITFQGNPKAKDADLESIEFLIMRQFSGFLEIISNNTQPFSSRIGITLFAPKLKSVSGKPLDPTYREKGQKILRSLAEGFRDEFTTLFNDEKVLSWLHQPFEKDYLSAIDILIGKCPDQTIKDYLRGQKDAYRHSRGIALRFAWLDEGLKHVIKGNNPNKEELIEKAEEYLSEVQRINKRSFGEILSLVNTGVYDQVLKQNLQGMKPEYLRLALFTFFEEYHTYEGSERIFPLTQLQHHYSEVKAFLGIVDVNAKWRSFSTVKKFMDNGNSPAFKALSDFGLEYDRKQGSFFVLNAERAKKTSQLYGEIKDTKVTKDTVEQESHNKDTDTKDTKDTKNEKVYGSVTFVSLCPNKSETPPTPQSKKSFSEIKEDYSGQCAYCGHAKAWIRWRDSEGAHLCDKCKTTEENA